MLESHVVVREVHFAHGAADGLSDMTWVLGGGKSQAYSMSEIVKGLPLFQSQKPDEQA